MHGKPRHPQSQGSVERGNAVIKDMLILTTKILSEYTDDIWEL